MSFNIALSGINASQKDLDVTANNISNVKTTGFKQSRAEFADVYATSIFNAGNTKVGDGVLRAARGRFEETSNKFSGPPVIGTKLDAPSSSKSTLNDSFFTSSPTTPPELAPYLSYST